MFPLTVRRGSSLKEVDFPLLLFYIKNVVEDGDYIIIPYINTAVGIILQPEPISLLVGAYNSVSCIIISKIMGSKRSKRPRT